jgi:pyruvate/2-oxoglutarate dehydrogenase complex dihydrolipoamide acyltransferase (E2) component
LVQVLSQVVAFVSYNLGLAVPALKVQKHHAGSFLLTNVSAIKGFTDVIQILYKAYGPITNFTRSQATVCMCAPQEKAIVENGEIKIGKIMNINITFDHRYLDGGSAPKMFGPMTDVWENPQKYF